jgi:hypothetical protein
VLEVHVEKIRPKRHFIEICEHKITNKMPRSNL